MLYNFKMLSGQFADIFELIRNRKRFSAGDYRCTVGHTSGENFWLLKIWLKGQKEGFEVDISYQDGVQITCLSAFNKRELKSVFFRLSYLFYQTEQYVTKEFSLIRKYSSDGRLVSFSVCKKNGDCIYYLWSHNWLRSMDITNDSEAGVRARSYENSYPDSLASIQEIHGEPIVWRLDNIERVMAAVFKSFDAEKFVAAVKASTTQHP